MCRAWRSAPEPWRGDPGPGSWAGSWPPPGPGGSPPPAAPAPQGGEVTWQPGMPSDAPVSDQPAAVHPQGGSIRIGDTERQEAADELREHFTAGRIDVDEFSARLGDALRASSADDLHAALRELPPIPGHHRTWSHPPAGAGAAGPGMTPTWVGSAPPPRPSRVIWGGLPAWAKVVLAVFAVWFFLSLWPAWLVLLLCWLCIIRPRRHRWAPPWNA